MRKKFTLGLCLVAALSLPRLEAQFNQVNNSGFETWQNLGASTEEPTEWNSFMTAEGGFSGFAGQQLRRSVSTRPGSTGSYSAILWSKSTVGVNANGNLTTGRVNMGSTSPTNSSNYNSTKTADPNFSETLGDTPDSLEFWVKYKPGNGGDLGRLRAVIHDTYDYRDPSGSDANGPNHIVGDATLNFPATSNAWVRKCIPFNYTGPASSPDYILISVTTCMTPGGCTDHDSLYIDDLRMIYNPTLSTGAITPAVYYVSATQGATVNVPFSLLGTMNPGNVVTAQLSDASGSFGTPVNLGASPTTGSGTVLGTIPAGTATGSGYRIRVVSTSYPLTATDNGANIQIYLVSSTIAPNTTQTLEAGVNGAQLSVTENASPISREWKYSTASGGPYTSFSSAQTGATFTPNFAAAGTYYVVCESLYPGAVTTRSNEVQINVVNNVVAPSTSQSILINVPGNVISVTETPAASSREWKYSATSGGPYLSFGTPETGTNYLPLFATPGTYYVICESVISGITVTSNEVVISVGSVTLATGTIAGSPYLFSANAPDAPVLVPFFVSDTLNPGNIFTAQLSDASGSFASPLSIGILAATMSDTISAVIPHTVAAGTGYRIRVVANNPTIYGADNGTDLVIDQFNNSVTPSTPQTVQYNTPGAALSVTESQTATRVWMYSTVSGGPYTAVTPSATGVNYTPVFSAPGTYYVVAASTNAYGDVTYSNEVQISVSNGTQISTSPLSVSSFYLSANAVVQVNVNFTSDIVFNSGNVFTAELSDANGSFTAPVTIGTLAGTLPGTITGTVPNIMPEGTGYRIRVLSSSPAATGTDNGSDLNLVQFAASITPVDTQYTVTNISGNTLYVTSSHPGVTFEWKYKTGLSTFQSFSPAEIGTSYTPVFASPGIYNVTCFAVNQWSDTTQAQSVLVYVTQNTVGIDNPENQTIVAWYNAGNLFINLSASDYQQPQLQLISLGGQVLSTKVLQPQAMNQVPVQLVPGMYLFRITDGGRMFTGRFVQQ